jgi:hypothetical protein
MTESIPIPDRRYLGMVRDWLNQPEQKGDWTLTFCYERKENRLFFTDENTAFACKMRWG